MTLMPQKTIAIAIAAFGMLAGARGIYAAGNDLADIQREIGKRHDEAVKRLQDWIALPSIAAENRNYPAGAETMARLAREAGFQQATVLNTDGKEVWRNTGHTLGGPSGWISKLNAAKKK